VRALGVGEERFPFRLPVNALSDDRTPHLGLQLVHHDALCDLVDLCLRQIRKLGHAAGELGNAVRQASLSLRACRHVLRHSGRLPVNLSGLHLLHNL
jgi:hypothetical protein